MAGIILLLGEESNQHLREIRENFENLKDLKSSFEYNQSKCQVVKYKRKYDEEDNNYFDCEEVAVCCVGTVLFRNYGFKESIIGIGKALCKGTTISEIVEEIDGHYFIVIISKSEKKCYFITDVGGTINEYMLEKDGSLYVSTSMLALAKLFPVTPQSENILMFIRSGMFFEDTTYFNEIKTLKQASIYEYDFNIGQLKRIEYWSVPENVNEQISFEDAVESITKSLKYIIASIPNKMAIYDFTGGYDARFVLSLAYSGEKDKNRINAFFFGPGRSREAKIVEENCLNLGIKYNNCVIPNDWPKEFYENIIASHNLCDGLENACVYAPILMTQKWKKKYFQYSVHGLFGELFRQRTWEFEFGRRGRRIPANLKRLIKYRNLSDDFDKSIFSNKPLKIISEAPNKLLEIYRKTNSILDQRAPNTLQLDNIYFAQRARRWGGRNITTANQIIQPICQLWFRKPLELSMSLPAKFKIRCKLMRHVVEKESPIFAKEKMITGTPFVVMSLANINRFIPGISFFVRKAIRKISQVAFNKTIWAGLTTPDYKTGEWFSWALMDPRCQDLLEYNKMITQSFYDERKYRIFLERARSGNFHFYGQLGNIITAELTLRSVNIKGNIDFY